MVVKKQILLHKGQHPTVQYLQSSFPAERSQEVTGILSHTITSGAFALNKKLWNRDDFHVIL